MVLEKAKLIIVDGEGENIEVMFNPQEISFTRRSIWDDDPGNRGEELLPKVNFGGLEPYNLSLNKLIFDTYETKESVMKKYINNIKKGVNAPTGVNKRPPVYLFTWGDEYFHCVMTSLTYSLTMFLTDGTPVRAFVDIALKEVDKPNVPGGKKSGSAENREPESGLGPVDK
ncbi:MAG: hypothetical protein PUP91_21310 [Rhizonema sp. PD37]|nr:hypothetical protein [Rhizonema sp. PD37]